MNAERIFIIQPVEGENARILHEEAVALVESAGAEYDGTVYQNIREINPATYVGEGKLKEINKILFDSDTTVLFNGELSPSQTLNISAALGDRKVIDRTTLILDIFALRAASNEGKIQVELAQLKYLYPRLKGKGAALSRLGGGIGTRGPGETKLETDRRHIRTRIRYLEEKLSQTEQRRRLQAERRKKERVRTIALVGYTNTGKSTLMNALTGADVFVKNALFATLDPTARGLFIENVPFLLVDTVGFLQKLPHNLIEAFRSTLESALNCDLALIVCDASGDFQMQLDTTLETLRSMEFSAPYLVVVNKCDLAAPSAALPQDAVLISAKNGTGLDGLKARIMEALKDGFRRVTLFIPYADSAAFAPFRSLLYEQEVRYTDDGIELRVILPTIHAQSFRHWIIK
ncbi:MAG: GTPase HflX [Clostridia bacterium]|nr:GTPase HflX [Clostridia bacterium]